VSLLLLSLVLFVFGGAAAAVCRDPRSATLAGTAAALAGCLAGAGGTVLALILHPGEGGGEAASLPWGLPFGRFAVAVDPLSGFFLLPLFALGAAAALYGAGYMRSYEGKKDLGVHWLFFNLLLASMALVFVARDGLLFLLAWETMSLSSFFLVTLEDEKEAVRFAGWVYLTATHLSAFFLLLLFLLLGEGSGSLSFDGFGALPAGVPATALFLLALAGFGAKAGLFPLHLWLPEAHPSAPSHVSALMSGVMINTGVYGLLRVLTFLGPPPPSWGGILLATGAVTAVMGVLYAIAQRDLKRVLAYSSVENMGITALALGAGLLGVSLGHPDLAVLGFAAAFLHLLNHSAMKGLLFLAAGAVLHAAGTRDLEKLGGLQKRMPFTGAAFAVGSVAIAGLPPFNGFAGEFLLALALLSAGQTLYAGAAVGAWAALAALGLTGGLAAACFARAYGAAFLGEPRESGAAGAHETGWLMRAPLLALAAACVLMGLLSPLLLQMVAPLVAVAAGMTPGQLTLPLRGASGPLTMVAIGGAAVWALVFLLAAVRRLLLAGRQVGSAPTWGCGYARPTPRMQYTASSFAQPLTALMMPLLGTVRRVVVPRGLFPRQAAFASDTPDGPTRFLFAPLFSAMGWLALRLRRLQHGHVHLYVLAIVLTLAVLLVWRLG
jgi:hydrogenase-4 component B